MGGDQDGLLISPIGSEEREQQEEEEEAGPRDSQVTSRKERSYFSHHTENVQLNDDDYKNDVVDTAKDATEKLPEVLHSDR